MFWILYGDHLMKATLFSLIYLWEVILLPTLPLDFNFQPALFPLK